jgi:CHAT domain-containing protein/Tfp pilus assembly protein PilF
VWVAWTFISCGRPPASPQSILEKVELAFVRGELERSQSEAEQGYQRFRSSDPRAAWNLRIAEAKAALWRGLYDKVIELLSSLPTSTEPDIAIPALTTAGIAHSHLHNFPQAEQSLNAAAVFCSDEEHAGCGDLLQARGLLLSEQGQSVAAMQFYRQSLLFARSRGDRFLESSSLLNIGDEELSLGHFDEAIHQSRAAYDAAKTVGAVVIELVTQDNIAWAYYKLGDSERALEELVDAEETAGRFGDFSDQENELTNIGYIYMDQRKFDLASQSFQRALQIANDIKAQQDMYNALRVLARLALQTSEPDKANSYAEQAMKIARDSGNHADELYPTLVLGQVAARRGDSAHAQQIFKAVEQDPACPSFLKWEAQHSLARLYEDEKQLDVSDGEFRAALATFESARSTVRSEDFQLSFLTNAAHIYDDYVHFLVAQGKTDDALRWADYNRARTLSEGLGLLSKRVVKADRAGPPPLKQEEISRLAKGVLLFYWLGEKQSYLWAVTPQKTSLFTLPPGADIDAMVQRYREALKGPQDVLQSSEDGRALYRTLIAPAKSLLANDAKVLIVPDSSLNSLNFETLVVAEPKPHYWIEDADIANVSSLRVLAASFARDKAVGKKPSRRLLLIGDSVAPSKEYPELQRAAQQMTNVARHFPLSQETVYQRDQATPAAYLGGSPGNFSHIHFVAHGTASRLSPLDSAIILSKSAAEPDSFKLYARDIVQHRLKSDLVTISACYGAGERAYSGEGLVGLAWAFLRAGAHNVIAGLWEVTDASTEQMMDRFYDELDKGASPDAALRAAKLSLLHGSLYHNPFYWAPFQLYTGA